MRTSHGTPARSYSSATGGATDAPGDTGAALEGLGGAGVAGVTAAGALIGLGGAGGGGVCATTLPFSPNTVTVSPGLGGAGGTKGADGPEGSSPARRTSASALVPVGTLGKPAPASI